ncbi:pyridoxal kinase-like [Actinia tenebrosa]|uniref:Pyridoxal kinase n=1 Tax=Actinia tenebrosa TaxID=6105 RepID=A0A6P8IVB0_ACTTE|nr:pyridoxal kinase-like [Actinia tenebrosa]
MSNGPFCRVLSIQSHVVSGYVGNKSATFPLQVLGFEVDTVNSVQLSNHTGYKYYKGQVLHASELRELFDGLKLNDIHHYSHLLTGYVGCKSFLQEVREVVKHLRDANPNLIFVCDPVMGDNGNFYVPEDLLPVYRDELVPLADIVTPNQFEAEMLTGIKINTEEDAFKAMKVLHDRGTNSVVITSSEISKRNMLVALGSSYKDGKHVCIRMEIPKLDVVFTGTGDLFTSLLLAWSYRHPHDLQLACEKTMSTVQTILKRTIASAKAIAGPDNKPSPAQLELKLVQSLDDIKEAKIIYKAEIVS